MSAFLRNQWYTAATAEELGTRPLGRRICNEPIAFFRRSDGSAAAVTDRCPHRNASLHVGWVEKDAIRCFYHGWKFSGSGECLEMPCEKESFVKKVNIRSWPVREYLGLVFAYFGEGEPPEFPLYPELEEDNGLPLLNSRWELPHNYFQRMENDLDEAHVNFVHKKIGRAHV